MTFSKLINTAVPGTIDERVVNLNPSTPDDVIENINLAINSAKAIGCNMGDMEVEAIVTGDERKLMRIVSEIERQGQLHKVSVWQNKNLLQLAGEDDIQDFVKLAPEQLLLRWVNHHLINANRTQLVTNFSSDIRDSAAYCVLLNQLAPSLCDMSPLKEANLINRAELVLGNAAKINCRKYVSSADVAGGESEKNIMFVANLYNTFPNINVTNQPKGRVAVKQEAVQDLIDNEINDKREERGKAMACLILSRSSVDQQLGA